MNNEMLENELEYLIQKRDELLSQMGENNKKIDFYNREIENVTKELAVNRVTINMHPINGSFSRAAIDYSNKKSTIQIYKNAKRELQEKNQDILEEIEITTEKITECTDQPKTLTLKYSFGGTK